MKYFLDTEFIEGTQKTFFGQTKPTIDLISIGIVSEDGREFYAISKDFNLKDAWNRYDLLEANTNKNHSLNDIRIYWIRENVLKPIWLEYIGGIHKEHLFPFNYKNMKMIFEKIGEPKEQIAFRLLNFIHGYNDMGNWLGTTKEYYQTMLKTEPKKLPEFYAYYGSYDWVAFCWIFGKMIDLPKGFPMYCNDLKQTMDEKCLSIIEKIKDNKNQLVNGITKYDGFQPTLDGAIKCLKDKFDYPKQTNEHNALADAKWNFKLYKFLQGIKWIF